LLLKKKKREKGAGSNRGESKELGGVKKNRASMYSSHYEEDWVLLLRTGEGGGTRERLADKVQGGKKGGGTGMSKGIWENPEGVFSKGKAFTTC